MFTVQPMTVSAGEDKEFAILRGGTYAGIKCNKWAFQCCGTGTIQGLGNLYLPDYATKAAFLATLYREMYVPANVFYVIQAGQYSGVHAALLGIGSKMISEFPNQMHGPAMLQMWHVNVRDGVGIFYDKYGEPFTAPPDVVPAIPPRVSVPQSRDWQELPVKPVAQPVKEHQDEQPA